MASGFDQASESAAAVKSLLWLGMSDGGDA